MPNFSAVSAGTTLPPQTVKKSSSSQAKTASTTRPSSSLASSPASAMNGNSYPEFHQGVAGYGRYYWHTLARHGRRKLHGQRRLSPLSSIRTTASTPSATAAVAQARLLRRHPRSHHPSGQRRPNFNFSEVIGSGAAAGVSSLYYPTKYHTWTKVGQRWLTSDIIDAPTSPSKSSGPTSTKKSSTPTKSRYSLHAIDRSTASARGLKQCEFTDHDGLRLCFILDSVPREAGAAGLYLRCKPVRGGADGGISDTRSREESHAHFEDRLPRTSCSTTGRKQNLLRQSLRLDLSRLRPHLRRLLRQWHRWRPQCRSNRTHQAPLPVIESENLEQTEQKHPESRWKNHPSHLQLSRRSPIPLHGPSRQRAGRHATGLISKATIPERRRALRSA